MVSYPGGILRFRRAAALAPRNADGLALANGPPEPLQFVRGQETLATGFGEFFDLSCWIAVFRHEAPSLGERIEAANDSEEAIGLVRLVLKLGVQVRHLCPRERVGLGVTRRRPGVGRRQRV